MVISRSNFGERSEDVEDQVIGARIADARSRLKAMGRRVAGAVPYGYDADPKTK